MNNNERSQAQIDASRANGALSTGPTTQAGRQASNRSRITHGFRSNTLTLSNEDKEQYDQHLDAYLAKYQPQDKVQEDLVGLAASSMWNYMRLSSVEVCLLEMDLADAVAELEERNQEDYVDEAGRLALAFKKSAGDRALELVIRYKTTAERSFHRAIKTLDQALKSRKTEEPKLNVPKSAVPTREFTPKPTIALVSQPEPRPQAPLEAA
jgi:hypothetical protein